MVGRHRPATSVGLVRILESVFGLCSRVFRLVGLPEGLLLVRPGANAVDLLFLLAGSAPGSGGGLVSGVGGLELDLRLWAAAQAFFRSWP